MSNPTDVGRTDRIKRTVDILTRTGWVPTCTAFDITEEMLSAYIEVYGNLGESNNKKFQRNYARKLAGLELLRLKLSRGAKTNNCKEGMVYLIANPAWPDHLKIGMTVDTASRLSSYQTYDPFKKFYIKHYEFCLNRRKAEQELLDKYNVHSEDGEWVKYSDALEIIKIIRN